MNLNGATGKQEGGESTLEGMMSGVNESSKAALDEMCEQSSYFREKRVLPYDSLVIVSNVDDEFSIHSACRVECERASERARAFVGRFLC